MTNGSKLLVGIDGRSPAARRFRDLVAAYTSEIGGDLTEVERGLVKQAAALTLTAEGMQADVVNGKPVDTDAMIRVTSTAKRILGAISAKAAKRKPQGPDLLRDYLATSNFQVPDDAANDAEHDALEPESTPIP